MLAALCLLALALGAQGCNQICHYNWAPVCGSDGKTYGNECELTSTACRQRSSVRKVYDGECVQCNQLCHFNYDPVCGSDGKTYGNQCELESLSCQQRSGLKMAHKGKCAQRAVTKVCDNKCHFNYAPVCGTDGRTYGNLCELTSLACQRNVKVSVAHEGECAPRCNIRCHRNWAPMCGSDGKTYGNLCELESLSCQRGLHLSVAHEGECVQKTKVCDNRCHRNWAPVCGTDGKTYGNACELTSLACQRSASVSIAHQGECGKTCNNKCHRNWAPVCGSDGKTYANTCEFESFACMSNTPLRLVHSGSC